MSGRKQIFVMAGLVTAAGLTASSFTAMLLSKYYTGLFYRLSDIARGEAPGQEAEYIRLLAAAGFLAGILLFLVMFLCRNRSERGRIEALTDYLEQVNLGKAAILPAAGRDRLKEGAFARLEDEIYKTVTYLVQTKEAAVRAREEFAENLANIAHQIKTPITAISLSVQMMRQPESGSQSRHVSEDAWLAMDAHEEEVARSLMRQTATDAHEEVVTCSLTRQPENARSATGASAEISGRYLSQISRQLLRLTRLEEALLVLSRIDAGTLSLQRQEVDVYTLLVLAADNLQELFAESGTSVEIPEHGEMAVTADLDWTMEAVMNLMKNCMEHNKGGAVHCDYAQNLLYTQILIRDEGEGFAREDLPHLFERFYRGTHAGGGGVGIGLALAKEIIVRQNGTIRARNLPEGGACFEIRFYRQGTENVL